MAASSFFFQIWPFILWGNKLIRGSIWHVNNFSQFFLRWQHQEMEVVHHIGKHFLWYGNFLQPRGVESEGWTIRGRQKFWGNLYKLTLMIRSFIRKWSLPHTLHSPTSRIFLMWKDETLRVYSKYTHEDSVIASRDATEKTERT